MFFKAIVPKLKRKIRTTVHPDGERSKRYLEDQGFYPISHTIPQDVFIAGYPKSGNTWMQHLIASLLFGVDPQFLPDKLAQELVPEVHVKIYYKRFLPFTCFKTHALPQTEYKRVIHLMRDGRDVMASYFAMNKALGKNISLEEMTIEGKSLFPCKWHEHTRKWIENPYSAEIIVVKYEDLLNDPEKELRRICSFISIERSDELIGKCVEGNSFVKMQIREKKYGMNNKKWDRNKDFVRKGKSGVFKTELPENLIEYFTEEAKRELEHFGYI